MRITGITDLAPPFTLSSVFLGPFRVAAAGVYAAGAAAACVATAVWRAVAGGTYAPGATAACMSVRQAAAGQVFVPGAQTGEVE